MTHPLIVYLCGRKSSTAKLGAPVLVISNLKLDMEYSIPLSFIMTLTTFSDANDALKAESSLLVPLARESVSPQNCLASRLHL